MIHVFPCFFVVQHCLCQMKRKYGVVLTSKQVMDIYSVKLQLLNNYRATLLSDGYGSRGMSSSVAKQFGVSPKTVRDIWNRRTWRCATEGLFLNAGGCIGSDGAVSVDHAVDLLGPLDPWYLDEIWKDKMVGSNECV